MQQDPKSKAPRRVAIVAATALLVSLPVTGAFAATSSASGGPGGGHDRAGLLSGLTATVPVTACGVAVLAKADCTSETRTGAGGGNDGGSNSSGLLGGLLGGGDNSSGLLGGLLGGGDNSSGLLGGLLG
jgi:hypothetical protein